MTWCELDPRLVLETLGSQAGALQRTISHQRNLRLFRLSSITPDQVNDSGSRNVPR
jgi:hypothetical protein